jgi:hypothetical protein
MLATLALAIVATATATAAETSGEIVLYNGHSMLARAGASFELVDEGPVEAASVVASHDDSMVGTIVYAWETGRIYGQGSHSDGRWLLDGQCDEDDACTVELCSTSGTSVAAVVVAAGFVGDETFEVGPLSFAVEWGGENLGYGHGFVEQRIDAPAYLTGGEDGAGLGLTGIMNIDTGELSVSWLPADGSLRAALLVEADCGVTDADYLVCSGESDLWREKTETVTTLGYWGYEHMTTVKGFSSVTLPHRDGMRLTWK